MYRITEFFVKNVFPGSREINLLYGLFALGVLLSVPAAVFTPDTLRELENDLVRLADGLKNGVLVPASPDTAGRYILGWSILMFSGMCGAGAAVVGASVLMRGFYDGYIVYRLVALLGAGGLGTALVAVVIKEALTLPIYCAMGANSSQKAVLVYEFCFGCEQKEEDYAFGECSGTEETDGDTHKMFRKYIGVCFIYGILMLPGFIYETKGLQLIFNVLS